MGLRVTHRSGLGLPWVPMDFNFWPHVGMAHESPVSLAHGAPMGLHGTPMDHGSHGFIVLAPWVTYGSGMDPMGDPWISHGSVPHETPILVSKQKSTADVCFFHKKGKIYITPDLPKMPIVPKTITTVYLLPFS